VEGANNVAALLDNPEFETQRVFVEEGRHQDLLKKARNASIVCQELSSEMMAGAAGYQFHRGVFAHAKRPDPVAFKPDESLKRLVVLTHLADEWNLGTIIRTAAAFGTDAILLQSNKGGDPFSRKSIRASATGVFKVPVYEVEDVAATLSDLKKNSGFRVIGAAIDDSSIPLRECRATEKMAVVLGAEKDGIPKEIEMECDVLTSLEMARGMDSLNVAGCAAVVLYELFHGVGK